MPGVLTFAALSWQQGQLGTVWAGDMQQLVEVRLPDGQEIWARIESPPGPQDSGFFDGGARALRGFDETLRSVAANVRDAVAQAGPDEVSVEFGVELALGKDGLIAALAGVSGTAAVKVTLSWSGQSDQSQRGEAQS
ncbi:CU044_2847 family protein [Streptomyces sp. NPDC005283]|uniref:CU044_2847 family protein n=1 Tax=Streptomyces sp. NPDC005283 TaxID=3156871 RepID=UPI003455F0F7